MSRLLLINRRPDQRRVALIENGLTAELFFERLQDRGVVGNIYLGRVVRVLPGMQAAFVDVGLGRTGFLFVGDVTQSAPAPDPTTAEPQTSERYPPIASLLTQGDKVLVQVKKAPIGTKGARLTMEISLPGRHVVYTPTNPNVGISRQIQDAEERDRLRAIFDEIGLLPGGVIVRTAAEGLAGPALAEDLEFLKALWSDINKRSAVAKAPALVHEDLDLTLRSVRDLLRDEPDRVVVDDDVELERILDFVRRFMPRFESCVERWDSSDEMLERYGVAWEIVRASRRKVWLKSGGYILIERTEALTVVDVNSGRYVGKSSYEETVLDINLESLKEIAYQLRLRDIGGIVVIDFIDMESAAHRKRVFDALVAELARDRARTKVLPMSKLGLIELTRKRVRNTIVEELTEPCFYCDGKGYLRSSRIVADSLMFQLHQLLRGTEGRVAEVTAHPRITELLAEEYADETQRIEAAYNAHVDLVASEVHHVEQSQIVVR